jgi:hypothetical protein
MAQKEYHISFWKLLSIVGGSILVSIVGTAFTVANTGVNDHFILVRAVDDIRELKTSCVPRGEIESRLSRIESDISGIKSDVKEITQDIKILTRR